MGHLARWIVYLNTVKHLLEYAGVRQITPGTPSTSGTLKKFRRAILPTLVIAFTNIATIVGPLPTYKLRDNRLQ